MSGPNWKNRTLFHGDNLKFLRGMNSESVDLIYLDPPFNKSKDFHARPDSLAKGAKFQDRWSWEKDVQGEWADLIKDDHPRLMEAIESARYAHSDGMGAYMCFMAVRLMEMKRILKSTGSIYLHCDPTASHYLKACMDAIFGWRNFRNEIVWKRKQEKHNLARKALPKTHDNIFWYVKSDSATYNTQWEPYDEAYKREHYKHSDNRGNYATFPCTNEAGGNKPYEFRGITRAWRFEPRRMQELWDADMLTQATTGSPFRYKKYEHDAKGVKADSLWLNFHSPRGAKERTGYPTQKPVALLERIIKASSNEGDMVLDPFCGCATTCVAAEQLDRQWVGIDIWEKAHEVVLNRLNREVGLFGDVTFTEQFPERTDNGESASPGFQVQERRINQQFPHECLTHKQIVAELIEAQSGGDERVICAGCGRRLEKEFMELDHIQPRKDGGVNDISNRILLCRPCNGYKRHKLTLSGLRDRNSKERWMKDRKASEHAQTMARNRYDLIRQEGGPVAIQPGLPLM